MAPSDSKKTTGPDLQEHSGIVEESLAEIAAQLVANGSIEQSIGDDQSVPEASQLLPYGMSVFVPSPRKRDVMDNLAHMQSLHESGFDPVPHIAARTYKSRQELKEFLQAAVAEFGVHRVLLIGGDDSEPQGPYENASAILKDGILSGFAINEVVLAGYPEGHPVIPQQILQDDLEEKLQIATDQGLCVELVTQFCFAPSRVIEYCASLALRLPELPVYVGMAGPASTARLMRYARYCGVSASLRALSAFGAKVINLVTHTDPSEQLDALAHYRATRQECNVIGVHVFSFGGFLESAQWMREKCRRR